MLDKDINILLVEADETSAKLFMGQYSLNGSLKGRISEDDYSAALGLQEKAHITHIRRMKEAIEYVRDNFNEIDLIYANTHAGNRQGIFDLSKAVKEIAFKNSVNAPPMIAIDPKGVTGETELKLRQEFFDKILTHPISQEAVIEAGVKNLRPKLESALATV